MMNLNTKIEPLREDLGRIIKESFLVSTPYKRWLVFHNLDDRWQQYITIAEQNRTFYVFGGNMDEYDAGNALTYMLNDLFENNINVFVQFII